MYGYVQECLFPVGGVKNTSFGWRICCHRVGLSTLAADATCQLDVLRHNGHALGVDGAQVRVLEEADQVGLGGFLQGQDG